jgi:hypothetical protein
MILLSSGAYNRPFTSLSMLLQQQWGDKGVWEGLVCLEEKQSRESYYIQSIKVSLS